MTRCIPFVFCVLCACSSGDGAAGSAAPIVRDSVGIQIVENSTPLWAEGRGWTVVDSPLVDVGGKAGDPEYDLSQVSAVLRLTNGRLVVGVGGAFQIRYYDAAGVHLATSGAKGDGPGEYQGMAGPWRISGDSVLVADPLVRRLTLLSDSGKVIRTFSLGGESGAPIPQEGRVSMAFPAGAFRDGTILGTAQAFRVNDDQQGAYRDSATYLVYSPAGVVRDTMGRFPGIEMEQMTMNFGGQSFNAPSPVPLGRNTVSTVAAEAFFVAKNDAWEIEVYSPEGRLTRLIRVRADRRPITPQDVTAHRLETRQQIEDQPMLRGMPEMIRKQMFDRVEQARYPETFPWIVNILAATDGTLWVQEQGKPGNEQRVMAVIDSAGRFLGRITLPDRFQPTFADHEVLAGIWKDADDVEHARIYAIRRP